MQAKQPDQPDQLQVTELGQDSYRVDNLTKNSSYTVSCGVAGLHHPVCNCPARKTCKHIFAVQEYRESMEAESNVTPIDQKPKSKPFARPILEILGDLRKPIPKRLLDTRKQGSANLTYVPWYNVVKLLDWYAPGWEGQVVQISSTPDRIFLTYRLTIHAAEGRFTREATGTETLKEEVFDKTTNQKKLREHAYGDPSSNAESMSFRRAAAKFGLGLDLYDRD